MLQMMTSLDGMVSGPNGELDWMVSSAEIEEDHQKIVEEASLVVMGAGAASEMSGFWTAAEHDEAASPAIRGIGRAINDVQKVVYSHEPLTLDWQNAEVRVIESDEALIKDVLKLKQETEGTIVVYGGVRFARSLVKNDLLDELHLDVCPVILGEGQPLFTELTRSTKLHLLDSVVYDSGTTLLHYEVKK